MKITVKHQDKEETFDVKTRAKLLQAVQAEFGQIWTDDDLTRATGEQEIWDGMIMELILPELSMIPVTQTLTNTPTIELISIPDYESETSLDGKKSLPEIQPWGKVRERVLVELRSPEPDEEFIAHCLVGQEHLDFSNCIITSDMFVTLAHVLPKLPALRTLNLASNYIEADVLPLLPALLTLNSLNLGDNKIGDEGACTLAPVLLKLPALCTLSLGGNQIGDKGARALAKILCDVYSVKELYLNDNPIGIEGLRFLVSELAFNGSLTTLTLPKIDDAKTIATAQKWLARNKKFPLLSSSIATYIKEDLFSDLLQFLPRVLVELVNGYLNNSITSQAFLTRLLSDGTKSEWQAAGALNQYQAAFTTEENAKTVAARIEALLAQHGLSNVTVITLAYPSENRFVVNIEITPQQIHTLVSSIDQLLPLLPQKESEGSDSKAEQKRSMVGESLSRAIGGGKNKEKPSDTQPASQKALDNDDTGYHMS